jgi:putative tricarboxylic transport membrane protein
MDHLWAALEIAMALHNIGYLLLGCIAGLMIGVLPGMGPVFGVALFLPLTFNLPIDSSLILLSAVYASVAYSDGITSILLNVPCGPGGLAVTFDGYPLTKQGKAGIALGALAGSALIGDMIGILALVTIAPALANLSLLIGPAEYFMLCLFGLSMVAIISKGSGQTVKGLILGCLGLTISFMGRDIITGATRFTFGSSFLEDGITFVSASIGLFALSQAFILAEEGGSIAGENVLVSKPWQGVSTVFHNWVTTVRSAVLGVAMSLLPGIGITTSTLFSYMVEQRLSKDPDSYGKGNIRGVIAPQAAANSTASGELIPALALGIPSGATSAIFIAALTLHGLRPGVEFFSAGGAKVDAVFIGMFLAALVFFAIGIFAAPIFARITKVPTSILVPLIVVLCLTGSFVLRSQFGDLIVTICFGVLGYFLFKHKWPYQTIVLGLILGSLAESNFHRALQISNNSYSIFIQKPFSLVLLVIIVGMFMVTYLSDPIKKLRGSAAGSKGNH